MKRKLLSTGKDHTKVDDGEDATANQLGGEVKLADLIWVKINGGSWWPVQVVDDNAVSRNNKPSKRSAGKVLVRLYGSYKYMYVDPVKRCSDFERILKQNNGSYREILLKALEQDISCSKSRKSKKKGSKYKDNVAVDAPRRTSDRNHTRKTQGTDSSYLVRVSPRRQRNAIMPQGGVKPNMPIAKEEEAKRKSSRESGLQKKLKGNGSSDEAEVLSKSQVVIARRLRVMQHLGLVAPSGSQFHKNRLV